MNWKTRGKPLDFVNHRYLKQIYEDQSQEIVYQKSAQVGLSERMITECLWLPDQHTKNSIYFFPTGSTVGDLVKERIDQPINASKYLSEMAVRAKASMGKHTDSVGLKKLSKGFAYFRSTGSLSNITSVSADAIFVDELDRMPFQKDI